MSRHRDDSDDLYRNLSEALGAIPKTSQPAVPQAGRTEMALPPGLVEEAARILYEFWEREAEKAQARKAIPWELTQPRYQVAWISITRVVLQMSVSVLLNDLNHFLDTSNGDMGAAFSRALQRYAATVLQTALPPLRS